jgi:hypothetical protein
MQANSHRRSRVEEGRRETSDRKTFSLPKVFPQLRNRFFRARLQLRSRTL